MAQSVSTSKLYGWVTKEINPEVVTSDSFVDESWECVVELAVATVQIELFGILKWDGKKDGFLQLAEAV